MAPPSQETSRPPGGKDQVDATLSQTTEDGNTGSNASGKAQTVAQTGDAASSDQDVSPDHQAANDDLPPPPDKEKLKAVLDGESENANAGINHKYHFLSTYYLDKERKLGRLGVRSNQAIIHQSLVSMRIDELEKQVGELETIIYDRKSNFKGKGLAKEKLPVHLHELRRSNKSDFRPSKEDRLLPAEQQPALEVQLSEWSRIPDASKKTMTSELDKKSETKTPATGVASGNSSDTQILTPERLRVRSRPLLHHLERVCGVPILVNATTTSMGDYDDKEVYNGVLFLRPFKLFVKHESAIRQSLVDLIREMDEQKPDNEAVDSSEKSKDEVSTADGTSSFNRKDLLEDLRLLIEFFDHDLSPTFRLRQQIKDGTATEIAYADLWHLFERGDSVVTPTSQSHGYTVFNYAGGRDRLGRSNDPEEKRPKAALGGFVVDCVSMGTDGSSYVSKVDNITIRMFPGTKSITSLPVYPLRFDPRADDLRSNFVRWGKKFLEVTSKPFFHAMVRGKTLDEPSYELDDQVIVDMTLAIDATPEWRPKPRVSDEDLTQRDQRETIGELWCNHYGTMFEGCCGADTIFKDLKLDDQDADEFIRKTGTMMAPLAAGDIADDALVTIRPLVHAFVLRSRRWATVRVEDLQEVEFENSFKDLVLPSNDKVTIQALVQTHHNTKTTSRATELKTSSVGAAMDIVKGKGRGLIILLHGPPGVGKTSTAECVADETKKPLFPITCGDLGETAADVENKLQYNFRLAHKWGCVLLLDEADIFLAKRTKTDLRHNAVTSIFLRSLEYYAGILFLTTNRVGVMDPAFKSRVQMSLAYHALNLDVTCQLFEKFIKRAKAEQDRTETYNFKIKEKEILRFAKKHYQRLEKEGHDTWNGRQIRNAFQTAIALAEHAYLTKAEDEPKPVLGKAQFETVADGLRAFDRYLIATQGVTESDAAKKEGVRNDYFNSPKPSTLTPSPSITRTVHGRATPDARTSQQADSDDESESDSDSDEDSSEDDDPKADKTKAKAKNDVAGGAPEASEASSSQASQMEQFQQFLKWQKMQ